MAADAGICAGAIPYYLFVVESVPTGFVPVVSTGVVATVSVVVGAVVEGVDMVDESLLMVAGVVVSEPVDFSGEWHAAAANARHAIKTMLFM